MAEQQGFGFKPPVATEFKTDLDLVTADAENMLEQLSTIAIDSVSKMPEAMFVNIYLPMFLGEENLNKLASPGSWASFAGNVYREVAVLDAQGNILFLVPPLVAPAPINVRTDRESRRSMFDEISTARQHMARHPDHGVMYMRDVFSRLTNDGYNSTQVLNYLERWNNIFKRYGKTEIPLPATIDGTATTAATTSTAKAEEEDWDIV